MTRVINDGKITMTLSADESVALYAFLQKQTLPAENKDLIPALSEFMQEIRHEANGVDSWSDEQLFEEESK